MKPLLFIADAHLTRDDPEVETICSFLRQVGSDASAIGILGDLFNIWLGEPKFALPHHARVLQVLEDLRREGVRLIYVEGNRDFHLRRAHLGRPFHDLAEDAIDVAHAGWRIRAVHGDSVNVDDRPYRAWKAFSKSGAIYGAFSLLPGAWGTSLGESLERRLSGTNIRHKAVFPREHCLALARRAFEAGCHALVMGHFHEERRILCGTGDGRPLGVYVLPAWRDSHRYLVFEEDVPPEFRSFER